MSDCNQWQPMNTAPRDRVIVVKLRRKKSRDNSPCLMRAFAAWKTGGYHVESEFPGKPLLSPLYEAPLHENCDLLGWSDIPALGGDE